MRLLRAIVAFACVVWATHALPAHAEIRALLIGAWNYQSKLIPSLKGPANDLPAVESLLRAQGATDITTLTNANATRTTIETAIHALGLRAKPGDWIVLYYSGHGAQAQAAVKGEEDDDLDEFLVLSGFDIAKPDPEQYVIDNDLHAWLSSYIPADVEVLQIADSCHSGTLNRSIDPRAYTFTPRLAFRGGETLTLAARPAPQFAPAPGSDSSADPKGALTEAQLPNVVDIGAAQDDQFALEASLPVQGAPSRGLLTYALEQALTTYAADGKTLVADLDKDGAVTIGELAAYLDSQTRTISGQRQKSATLYAPGGDKLVLFKPKANPAAPAPPPAATPALFVADPRGQALVAGDPRWRVVSQAADADFVWDFAGGAVLHRSGDVVANGVTSLVALSGVLDKWAAVESLRPLLAEGGAKVGVGPQKDGVRYAPGAQVNLTLNTPASASPGFLTVFDLASDGTVQTLFPLKDDGEGRLPAAGTAAPLLETRVVAPYGADHVVAVVTPDRPDALRQVLTTVEGTRAAARVAPAVRDALAKGGRTSLSIGELYTGS